MVKVLPEAACVFAAGSIAAIWLLFPERRTLHRTRLLADFLAKAFATGSARDLRFKPAYDAKAASVPAKSRRRNPRVHAS